MSDIEEPVDTSTMVEGMEESQPHRRYGDTLIVLDDTNTLTRSEIIELKKIANASKTTKLLIVAGMALYSLFHLPEVIDFFARHWSP